MCVRRLCINPHRGGRWAAAAACSLPISTRRSPWPHPAAPFVPLSTLPPPSPPTFRLARFGGDEVNAIVVDIGASLVKAGWAGEDAPRFVFSSLVGAVPAPEEQAPAAGPTHAPAEASEMDVEMVEAGPADDGARGAGRPGDPTPRRRRAVASSIRGRKFLVGDSQLSAPTHAGHPIQVQSPFATNGVVQDWDAMEAIWNHVYDNCLLANPTDHPLLVTGKRPRRRVPTCLARQLPRSHPGRGCVRVPCGARRTPAARHGGWGERPRGHRPIPL